MVPRSSLSFFVQRVFVRDLILDAPPVDRILLLPFARQPFQPVALLFQLGQRLQVDIHPLGMGLAADDDLRRNEGDHQHQVGDERHAQPDAVVVRPRTGILLPFLERQAQAGAFDSFSGSGVGMACFLFFRTKILFFSPKYPPPPAAMSQ